MVSITRRDAKRFILRRQGLLGKHVFIGKEGALAYVRQAGCIQFDPVDVCGKNAQLTLLSRVKGFSGRMLDELLYRDRLLVDYCDKELSIWPAEDWPHFARFRERSMAHGALFDGIPALEETALSHIREHGPVSSDTLPVEGRVNWHSSMHWSGNWQGQSPAARSVLEQLYTDGTLLIHHKSGARKYYDLAERLLPASLLAAPDPCPGDDEFLMWRLLRRVKAVGMLWDRRSDAFLGIDMTPAKRSAAFEALEKKGALLRAEVEGLREPLYLPAEDAPLMGEVLNGSADTSPRLEFLAPLDPLLWDRRLVEAIWGFRYTWEIYTPADKRKFGCYTLPMLRGEEFVGRIEAAADRKAGVLTVKNVWYEDGVRPTKALVRAVERAAGRLAKFNGCALAPH